MTGVYPRVGGGNAEQVSARLEQAGLSPRGRGKPTLPTLAPSTPRSIPAWAGETHILLPLNAVGGVYPRVGGGNQVSNPGQVNHLGLSPRGRGKPQPATALVERPGSIPAWAGETAQDDSHRLTSAVYPRVGGGNLWLVTSCQKQKGLSPRGRGKRVHLLQLHLLLGSIPAWAGETCSRPPNFCL